LNYLICDDIAEETVGLDKLIRGSGRDVNTACI
jgi:hypothetical protein